MKFKSLFILSFFLVTQAFSRTTETVNEPLNSAALRSEFCSILDEIITADVGFSEAACNVEGAVRVVQKIYDRLAEVNILTGLSLNYSEESQGLTCSGRAIKGLKTTYVDDLGNIQNKPATWRIVNYKCNSTVAETNDLILSSNEGDDNVVSLSEAELAALSDNLKSKIVKPDMVSDGDSAYYSVIEDTYKHFKILDPEDTDVVLGYLTTAELLYSEDEDEENSASAYFNAAGVRLDEFDQE